MDSFEAIWPLSLTLKAQHLLVLDVKLNPLMISSLLWSHGKFLLDYIVRKALNSTLNLSRLFASRPWTFGCYIALIEKCREHPTLKRRFRSLMRIHLFRETLLRIFALDCYHLFRDVVNRWPKKYQLFILNVHFNICISSLSCWPTGHLFRVTSLAQLCVQTMTTSFLALMEFRKWPLAHAVYPPGLVLRSTTPHIYTSGI